MKERIIIAPGLNGSELLHNLTLHGVNSFNTRVFSPGEFARYVLLRSGVIVSEEFLDTKEENAIVAEVIKDETYFGKTSYSDIQSITNAIRLMRSLVVDADEDRAIEETMSKGLFKEKNSTLVNVYKKYKDYLLKNNKIDSVSLIRKAIESGKPIDAEFLIFEEIKLKPIERKLVEQVSNGQYKTLKIQNLFEVTNSLIKIESIKNCYGASNEVETIIADIYSGKKLDQCTVAVADISTYCQLFFDYSLLHNIPVTFGCGLPIINSNPARLLMLYNHWMTTGFFGTDAIIKMIHSDSFNRYKLKEELLSEGEEIKWKTFYKCLGDIKFTNDSETNKKRLEDYQSALVEESKYIVPGESKEYNEFIEKQKCIPVLAKMSEELLLPTEMFISKYAYLRQDRGSFSEILVSELDRAALFAIYEELKVIKESGISQSEGDIILNVLKMNVLNQKSKPGHLHITSIDKAICSIRDNLYIAGLSSTKYPGSPKENYLLLDEDIKLFGDNLEYLSSNGRIKRKRDTLITLAELASSLGSKINLSYSGLNVSELKHDNASSMIYELYGKAHGGNVSAKELEDATLKIGYFDPSVSSSRLIGEAYIDGKHITRHEIEQNAPEIGWNIEQEYSPTAIEKFMGCPRSFMLNYILGIPEPDENDDFNVISPKEFGTLAHSLMERLSDNNMGRDEFLELSGEFFDRYIAQHPSLILDKVPAERNSFIEMMENAYLSDPHRKVILKEEDIHCEHKSGVKLHGFPDRVEELEDGSLLIVDFKTGRNIKHFENDIDSCLQVVIYAYLMESKGYKVSGGEYRYIRLGKTVKCKYDDEIKEKLSQRLERFKDLMLSGSFPCGNACEFCKYESICKREQEEIIFSPAIDDFINEVFGEDSV